MSVCTKRNEATTIVDWLGKKFIYHFDRKRTPSWGFEIHFHVNSLFREEVKISWKKNWQKKGK